MLKCYFFIKLITLFLTTSGICEYPITTDLIFLYIFKISSTGPRILNTRISTAVNAHNARVHTDKSAIWNHSMSVMSIKVCKKNRVIIIIIPFIMRKSIKLF